MILLVQEDHEATSTTIYANHPKAMPAATTVDPGDISLSTYANNNLEPWGDRLENEVTIPQLGRISDMAD